MVIIMKKNKSIAKNYIYSLFYEILVFIVPLLTTPYISRTLGADGIGIYSYTLSIATYFINFGKLGFQTYGQLKIAESRDNKAKLSIYFWEITITRFLSMMFAILLYIIVFFIDKEFSLYYFLLLIFFASSILDFTWFLQGMEEFKIITIRNSIIKILSLILVFLFVKDRNDLPIYFIIIQGSTLLGNISLLTFIKKNVNRVKFNELHFIKHLKGSLPYFIPTIATTIYLSLDKSMIGWITNSNFENGFYEQAHKIEQVAVTIVTSLSVVTMPRIAYFFNNKELEKAKTVIEETIQFSLLISIPMTFGLIGISKDLIPWFLGDGYENCINLLRIFSALIIVVGLNNAVGKQVLIPMKRQKEYNLSVIIGAVTNAVLNSILIFKFAAIGAAIASVIAETVILILFMYYAKDIISIKKIFIKSFKYIMSSAVMLIVLILLSNKLCNLRSWGNICIEIVVGLIVYIFMIFLLRDSYILNKFKFLKNKIINVFEHR